MQPTLSISEGAKLGEIPIRCFCGEYSSGHDLRLVKYLQRKRPQFAATLVITHGNEPTAKAAVFRVRPGVIERQP